MEQVAGWRRITQAVLAKGDGYSFSSGISAGSRIHLLQRGQMVPIAPSALAAEGEAHLSKVRCPILYRALSHVVGLDRQQKALRIKISKLRCRSTVE